MTFLALIGTSSSFVKESTIVDAFVYLFITTGLWWILHRSVQAKLYHPEHKQAVAGHAGCDSVLETLVQT